MPMGVYFRVEMYFIHFWAYLGQLCPIQPNKLNNNYRYCGNGYADPVFQTQYIEVITKTYHTVNAFQIIQCFNQMTRRNHLIESTVRTKGRLTYITILRIAQCLFTRKLPGLGIMFSRLQQLLTLAYTRTTESIHLVHKPLSTQKFNITQNVCTYNILLYHILNDD